MTHKENKTDETKAFDSIFVVRFPGTVESRYGGVAQLGEHLPCKQGVKGSIPFISTSRQCRLPKPGVRSEKPTVKAEAEERGKGKETDGRIRAYELKSRFVAQVARARA